MDPITVITAKPPKITGPYRDYVKSMSDAELIRFWKEDITDPKTSYVHRNTVVHEMQQRDLFPTNVMHKREKETGVYPDIDDPDFATRLFQKMEFAELSSEGVEPDTCDKSQTAFDTTPVQRLIARFLHPSTPYRGVLLNHGVGVGKTCTAVTVAEMYLDLLPSNKVFIVAPVAIAQGFRRTIFDIGKLTRTSKEEFKLSGMYWKSNQCTGNTYLRLAGLEAEPNLDVIQRDVEASIRKRYKIFSYGGFASWVTQNADKVIPAHIQGEERNNKRRQNILRLFSDHLIIIDEAHNLRDKTKDEISEMRDEVSEEELSDEVNPKKTDDAAEGKRLSPILQEIMYVAEGLRVMLMTATPMYNVAQEIMFLLNLLLLNDTKDQSKLINVSDVFDANGGLIRGGDEKLTKLIRRYVSYMRGENPNSFPLRLSPEHRGGTAFVKSYPRISIRKREWGPEGFTLPPTESAIMAELPLIVHPAIGPLEAQLRELLSSRMKDDSHISFNLDQSIQLCNFVYPDDTYGSRAFSTYFEETNKLVKFGAYSAKQLKWRSKSETLESVFSLKARGDVPPPLVMHSPKIAAIAHSVSKAKGMSFIYSRYLKSGALLIAIALEVAGWCRVMADGTPAPLLHSNTGDHSRKPKYILLTSDEELSPNFSGLLQYATTFGNADEAANGTKVKAIIGSQVASEGLDLKCIRELHVLDGWFHLNRLEQIIGRGVRYCSHALLPEEERNCTIYLHCVALNEYETPDLFTYRVAVQKAAPIGVISRLIKVNAWDCSLNKDAIQLKGLGTRRILNAQGQIMERYKLEDKPYSGMCDFQESCEYACTVVDDAVKGENTSTFKEYDFRRRFMERFQRIVHFFEEGDTSLHLEFIRTELYDNMPWAMVAVWLRKMLGTHRIKRKDGIYGTLFIKNGYLVFQPEGVTDKLIPSAYRYGRAFGRIPSTIKPAFKLEATAQESDEDAEFVSKPIVEEASTEILIESALKSLRDWHAVLKKFIATPYGPVEVPEGPLQKTMLSMRYVYNHFGALEDTEGIGCAWWIDNIWTQAERNAVFADWIARGLSKLPADESFYAAQLTKSGDLFEGALRGYFIHYGTALKSYYYNSESKSIEPINDLIMGLLDEQKLVSDPVNTKEDTDAIYGIYMAKGDAVVFKTVVKGQSETGQECAITNLENPISRIRIIQTQLASYFPEDHILRKLLLDPTSSDEVKQEAKERSKKKAIEKRFSAQGEAVSENDLPKYCWELSAKQACQYMEYILRWMDRKQVNHKRWFLSLVDMDRMASKADKKEEGQKKRGRKPKNATAAKK